MFTITQLLVYAVVGAAVALVILRAEDKFNNKQYTKGQYLQAAVGGFLITLLPIWLLSRSASTHLTHTQQTGGSAMIRTPSASKPLNAPYAMSQPPTTASSSANTSDSQVGGGAFFTPIVNAVTPKMQFRTNGPTF